MDRRIKQKDFNHLTEEEILKLADAYGYGVAATRLENMKDDLDRYSRYYPFKLLNDEINEDKNNINYAVQGVKTITGLVGTLSSEKANFKDVESNKLSITESKKAIEKNNMAIAENRKLIEINDKDIAYNTDNINLNKKALQEVKQQFSQLSSRVENLNKSLKSGLATQSALNGLFQPYNIGKMNVSAALGGYKSHNALAVGAGFRFNKNVAAKAGISSSFDGSALSYNMGVNYEF